MDAVNQFVSCYRKSSHKQLVVCIQFPDDYPKRPVLFELKSKTLSDKLLDKLTDVCEIETKKYIGKPQILKLLCFIRNFLEENPLCCCYDEIAVIRASLSDSDELKLRQKTSTIYFKINKDNYYLKGKILISDEYPLSAIRLDNVESNFPELFNRFIVGQTKEIARQCVEPPLLKQKPQGQGVPFKVKPSLLPVMQFLISTVRAVPSEQCQLCHKTCLPADPKDVENNESASLHAERVYCGHLFHLSCLVTFMKTPPFQGGKKCPSCGQRIYHEKWKVSEKLAEDRWAHAQARNRELKEVEEFFE